MSTAAAWSSPKAPTWFVDYPAPTVRSLTTVAIQGSTQEAIDIFEASRVAAEGNRVWYAPGKAANW